MRRKRNYSIRKESYEDMANAGRYNPCLEVTFRDRKGKHTHKIAAGHGDDIHVYREGAETYVLSRNQGLGYLGLEVFEGNEKTGDIFLQGDQVQDAIGRDDLCPFNAIRRMREYIPQD